ncbi:MAG: hypothetical protein H0W49_16300 [Nitrospirales bacterium]|nr:hypothetical protein [Nitrospirales bacterium]
MIRASARLADLQVVGRWNLLSIRNKDGCPITNVGHDEEEGITAKDGRNTGGEQMDSRLTISGMTDGEKMGG